jgi:hypothetical protein
MTANKFHSQWAYIRINKQQPNHYAWRDYYWERPVVAKHEMISVTTYRYMRRYKLPMTVGSVMQQIDRIARIIGITHASSLKAAKEALWPYRRKAPVEFIDGSFFGKGRDRYFLQARLDRFKAWQKAEKWRKLDQKIDARLAHIESLTAFRPICPRCSKPNKLKPDHRRWPNEYWAMKAGFTEDQALTAINYCFPCYMAFRKLCKQAKETDQIRLENGRAIRHLTKLRKERDAATT